MKRVYTEEAHLICGLLLSVSRTKCVIISGYPMAIYGELQPLIHLIVVTFRYAIPELDHLS